MILIQGIKKIKGKKWIKELLIDISFYSIFLIVCVVLVYWKIGESRVKPLILESKHESISPSSDYNSTDTKKDSKYVASSRGKYFYEIGSKRANSLSEKNKIYFSDPEEAKKLGFKPYFES